MPSVLQCPEIHESVHETRLWMSSGNSSSSLHFDTHENLMLQVFGTKSVYMFPPSQSHKTYMDYHDRYGSRLFTRSASTSTSGPCSRSSKAAWWRICTAVTRS